MYNEDRFAPRNGWSNYPTWYAAEIVSSYECNGDIDEMKGKCKDAFEFQKRIELLISQIFKDICGSNTFLNDVTGFFYSNIDFQEIANYFWIT